jgi:hypothetical protein
MNNQVNIAVEDIDSIINLLSDNLQNINNSEIIYKIKKPISLYEKFGTEDKELFRKHIKNSQRLSLLNISELIAETALNSKDKDLAKIALYIHSIEDFKYDPRENIIYLSIIWYVCEKLSINPIELFSKVASLSSPQANKFILEFVERPTSLKNLNAMGLMASKENGKIIFEQKKAAWEK